MPQKIPPAAMAAAVIVAIIVIAIIGFKVFGPPPDTNTAEMRKKYMPNGGPMTQTAPKESSSTAPPGAPQGYPGTPPQK